MKRVKVAAALVLTAFFAVAGSFHHHGLPNTTHDHVGFCSAATVGIALESCALCRVAHASVELAASAVSSFTIDLASRLTAARSGVLASAATSLLRNPRAPPAV